MAITLCPYALAAGCQRCPVFRVCPLKGVIGDQRAAGSDDRPMGKSAGSAREKAERSGRSRR